MASSILFAVSINFSVVFLRSPSLFYIYITAISSAYAVNISYFPCPIFNPFNSLFCISLTIDSNVRLNKTGESASPCLTPMVSVNSSDIIALNLILHLEFCMHVFTILTSFAGIPSLTTRSIVHFLLPSHRLV